LKSEWFNSANNSTATVPGLIVLIMTLVRSSRRGHGASGGRRLGALFVRCAEVILG
jgi:hypothetical protein